MTDEELNNLFRYHEPTNEQIIRKNQIRASARSFAAMINANCPDSADKTSAIRKVREAMNTALDSISCNEK